MELEMKMLYQGEIPFMPVTSEKGVIVTDKDGNETTLDKILVKDTDMSLLIVDGVLSHRNEIIPKLTKGLVKLAYDAHGHITEGDELNLSEDFKEEDKELKINYNTI